MLRGIVQNIIHKLNDERQHEYDQELSFLELLNVLDKQIDQRSTGLEELRSVSTSAAKLFYHYFYFSISNVSLPYYADIHGTPGKPKAS
jgi:hypothetical protein